MNEAQPTAKFQSDKEIAMSHLNLQNYHPSLMDAYKGKFMMNSDGKPADGSALSGIHQNIFALNSISNQYPKGIDLASLHDSLNRAQTTLDESQNIRVKHLFSMTNNEVAAKTFTDGQSAAKNHIALSQNNSSNDRNNNKHSMVKEKPDAPQFKDFEPPADKPSQNIHTNAKSGVSLKCAYCEAREDFKSR